MAACGTSNSERFDSSTRTWPSASGSLRTLRTWWLRSPSSSPSSDSDGVVSKTVARSYATALWLYDLTGGFRIGSRHKRVTKAEALAHLPKLKTDHLVAGFLYFDARADDARLTLTVARTASLDYGAVVANYVTAQGMVTNSVGSGHRGHRATGRRRARSTSRPRWW